MQPKELSYNIMVDGNKICGMLHVQWQSQISTQVFMKQVVE